MPKRKPKATVSATRLLEFGERIRKKERKNERKNERKEERKKERKEGQKEGRTEGRTEGRKEELKNEWVEGWKKGREEWEGEEGKLAKKSGLEGFWQVNNLVCEKKEEKEGRN